MANEKKIRQIIRIDEVDNGGFKVTSNGRDPAKNQERVGTNAEDAKAITKELVDLAFEKPAESQK